MKLSVYWRNMEKLNETKKEKLKKYASKYKTKEKLIIATTARKTIKYIESTVSNFPNEYYVLKNRIIDSCYSILEHIYRANVFQDIDDKKEIIVKIRMLNYYLEEALNENLISSKKFNNYGKYLLEIDKMTREWINYELNSFNKPNQN